MKKSNSSANFYEMNCSAFDSMMPHCAVALILDTSHSMWGQGLVDMVSALQAFFLTLSEREFAGSQLDIAAISMGDNLGVIEDFTLLEDSQLLNMHIRPKGDTPMGAALELACQKIAERMTEYRQRGIQSVTPHLILLSDGHSSDDFLPVAEKIRIGAATGALTGYAVATGQNPDLNALKQIFGNNVLPPNFGGLKQAMAKIGEIISQSYEGEVIQMMISEPEQMHSLNSIEVNESFAPQDKSATATFDTATNNAGNTSAVTEYFLDGTNICYWGHKNQGLTLRYVEAIANHCEENNIPYLVCFDASTPYMLEKQSKQEAAKYQELLTTKPENFQQVPASTKADDFLLLLAEDNPQAIIISQDLFRDHIDKHPWLKNSNRVVVGTVLQNKIYFPGINVKISIKE